MHDPQPPDVRLANPGVIGVPGEHGTNFDVQFGVGGNPLVLIAGQSPGGFSERDQDQAVQSANTVGP